jgi:O-antigen/teichoic acid export membrane protein
MGQLVIFSILAFKNQFHKHLSFNINKEVISKMLSLGIIYAIALLVSQLNYKIDVILLENYSTSYELGIYSKGTSIVQYLWQIPTLFSTIIFSRSAASKDSLAFSKKVCQLLRISLVVIGIMSLFIGIFSKQIILLLFGAKFLDSVPVMQILLPGVVLLTVFKVMNMDLAGKGKPWIALQSMAVPLVMNVILNLIFFFSDYLFISCFLFLTFLQ